MRIFFVDLHSVIRWHLDSSKNVLRRFGGVALRLELDEGEEGALGDETSPAETNDRELSSGHELIGEGPRDAEQLGRLADGIDQTVRRVRSSTRGSSWSLHRSWHHLAVWLVGSLMPLVSSCGPHVSPPQLQGVSRPLHRELPRKVKPNNIQLTSLRISPIDDLRLHNIDQEPTANNSAQQGATNEDVGESSGGSIHRDPEDRSARSQPRSQPHGASPKMSVFFPTALNRPRLRRRLRRRLGGRNAARPTSRGAARTLAHRANRTHRTHSVGSCPLAEPSSSMVMTRFGRPKPSTTRRGIRLLKSLDLLA